MGHSPGALPWTPPFDHCLPIPLGSCGALPWDSMLEYLPKVSGLYGLLVMAGIALVGTFLPVPIAFDVIVVAVLIAAGMPIKYAMVLLFTLFLCARACSDVLGCGSN